METTNIIKIKDTDEVACGLCGDFLMGPGVTECNMCGAYIHPEMAPEVMTEEEYNKFFDVFSDSTVMGG